MKISDRIHGFRVLRVRTIDEVGGTLYEMEYEKNGARLCYLAREDKNKTFAIAFKTVPTDDTGVFHILEHSVLCGSDKYPVKEPFVALLKGSMQTFLNAFTFPDKTMYPVSSRVEKDFHNLMDIYMDAVLHPAALSRPEIFLQEGFHITTDEAGKHGASGVVYNEMKGAYSSPEDLMGEYMTRLLYPDTCYGHDSGGEPGAILSLTYEQFKKAHATFYHPSQALIFLDGKMDIEAALARLDGFLSPYEHFQGSFPDITEQKPLGHRVKTHAYEVGEADDGKARMALGYLSFRFDEQKKLIGLSVIADVLCGSNEAPLKKALLDKGLCEDVSLYSYDGVLRASEILEVRGASEESLSLIHKTAKEVFQKAAEAMDKERLAAALNQIEFRHREKDFGSYPRGLIYAMNAMESWLYDGDPAQNLMLNQTLAELRAAIDGDFYENLVREVFLENPHTAEVRLLPDKTLAQKRAMEEERAVAAVLSAMGKEADSLVKEREAALFSWQEAPDTKEALATLPTLSLEDIPKDPALIPSQTITVKGTKVLHNAVNTDGILYLDAFFEIPETTKEDLPLLSVFCQALGAMNTEKYEALALQSRIKAHLGDLSFSLYCAGEKSAPKQARLYLRAQASLLPSQKEAAIDLLEQILYHTNFDKEKTLNILRQSKLAYEEHILSAGHTAAIGRVFAAASLSDAVSEYAAGYEGYLSKKHLLQAFDEKYPWILEKFNSFCKCFFTKERVFISLTGEKDLSFLESFLSILQSGERAKGTLSLPLLKKGREGIATAARVAYAVAGGTLTEQSPAALVLRHLLSYEYLWNEIRVKNGAYGAGLVHRKNGNTAFYSYRDPSPELSLPIYKKAGRFVCDFVKTQSLTDIIIGTLGAFDPLLSPRMQGELATAEHLCGHTHEEKISFRRALLSIDADALIREANRLDALLESACVTVIGAREKLEAAKAKGLIDTVISFGAQQ